ncbi:BAF_collapsed_G0048700.mRNA.1.CDS.1 [Saccharomyces cerevisiae]|nr:Y55_G0054540.mRNA.1.CDS.1 [Saccharomyces cerevisiae]CAI4976525.1 BAD_HP_G0047750.mRNA.1.CDS.1 [Saccharomyces cerevisiae]CAI5313535.1 BAF_HP2_G0047570.mRNA.1.CDS.1 [Saccharomyces cerevisiae]CAI6449689.1 CBM_HP1_G0023670.mRNA.1.CDS.1 [Saccharomyces cerevisiae]CAI6698199.1 BAF_HP2_G0047570.mRNA.1.CDS.1 [Saccharomyces cerevisiae]
MGWDNWNTFACNVSGNLLLNTADRISDIGLKDLGYRYVILDDCWSSDRDTDDFLVADKQKFPNGMGHVAGHLHNNSFLFGILICSRVHLCCVSWIFGPRRGGCLVLCQQSGTLFEI